MTEFRKYHSVPELLAPAGSVEMMKAVIAAGADAVYIGGAKFGARAYADNPDTENLCRAIDYAHLRGVSVHMTVNTLVKEREMDGLCEYLEPYYRCGVDAVLVQDAGVLSVIRQNFPDLAVHASTQMSVTGPAGIRMLQKMGVRRVVFARELSLAEIREIRKETDMELEVFAHGALCVCYSGRCLMSSMLGGRSGNRGRCAQPCRLPYDLYLEGNKLNPERERYLLSPKDLCTIDLLPQLLEAGVDSLKIEGRMKKPEYAAGVTAIYRKYLDRLAEGMPHSVSKEDKDTLFFLFNRDGFTDGYLKGKIDGMMAQENRKLTGKEASAQNGEHPLPQPEKLRAEAMAVCRVGEPLSLTVTCGNSTAKVTGDTPEEAQKQPVTEERIMQQLGKTGDSEFTFTRVVADTDGKCFLPVSTLNRLRRDALEALQNEILAPYRREEDSLFEREPFTEGSRAASGTRNPEAAEKEALSSNTIKNAGNENTAPLPLLEVLAVSEEQIRAALAEPAVGRIVAEWSVLLDEDALAAFVRDCHQNGKEAVLALPMIVRNGAECGRKGIRIAGSGMLKRAAESGIDGFLARDSEGLALLAEEGYSPMTFADSSLYTTNRTAQRKIRALAQRGDTVSFELTVHETEELDNRASTLCVYGAIPLMVTAQCPVRHNGGCRRKPGFARLTDRKNQSFPVRRECAFCYNILYNSVPLSLLTEMKKIRSMHFQALRLMFAEEDGEKTGEMIRAFADALHGREPQSVPASYTKGHFRSGVE